MLVADRLMEARSEAMNGHVFNMISNECLTNLSKEPDLLPLTRRGRTSMADGILFQETSLPPAHASATTDIDLPQSPSSRSSVRKRTDSVRNDNPRMGNVNTSMTWRHVEDDPSCSPRIAADTGNSTQIGTVPEDSVQGPRQRYYGKDKGPSQVSGLW
jgi:hypothetical protein